MLAVSNNHAANMPAAVLPLLVFFTRSGIFLFYLGF